MKLRTETLQRIDRSTRPPSRGKPGIRLKSPIAMLIGPSQTSSVASGPSFAKAVQSRVASFMPTLVTREATTRKRAPSAMLVIGPTIAVRNSARAEGGSRSMFETPPKRKSVMLRTRMP